MYWTKNAVVPMSSLLAWKVVCVGLMGRDQRECSRMSKERGCVNIVQDGADDLHHGTGVEGNSLPCIKGHYPSKGFLYFTVGKARNLLFSLGYFRAISWTLYNIYFGKIFSALYVDVFPEIFRIFPNFDISWYMTKDSKIYLKNCLLIHTCSTSFM